MDPDFLTWYWTETANEHGKIWACSTCYIIRPCPDGFDDPAIFHTRVTGHRTFTEYIHRRVFESWEVRCQPLQLLPPPPKLSTSP